MRSSASLVLALLCGCVTVEPPQYGSNPFQALSSEGGSGPKLCVFFTENSQKALAHMTDAGDRLAFLASLAGKDTRKEMGRERLVTDVSRVLKARFSRTEHIEAMADARARGCSATVAFDMKIKLGVYPKEEVSVDIAANFVNDQGSAIDTIRAAAMDRVPNPNTGPPFNEVWASALGTLGRRMDQSAPISIARGLPVAAPAALAVAPAALELAFWDSVKTSGNPADLQAYLQKFPNGNFSGLARTRLAALGEAAPVRLTPLALPPGGAANFGGYHALVIGINKYRAVTPLKTAVHDARTVADLLQKEYGFKVTLLLDATRNQVLDAFDDLRRTLTENDNLLIYYAGHGHLDADSDRGFWLPVDADPNRRANWLSNSDIADVVRATRAKHVLVVADSCYAGTLTRSLSVQLSGLDDLSRLAQKRARTALVSGGLEPVEDAGGGNHSVFAKAFLDALLANTGAVEMSQIFSSMRRQVLTRAAQTPQYGDIRQTGHEGGDFIFVRRK